MNNRQIKSREVKFELNQLPKMLRGKDHAKGDDVKKLE